ncbi:hypothetical protein DMH02_017255 [Streptomyces sp. WAC 00631]|uniref:hypothetical protein n=1 Tax=Streptomyces sp. WAC 00631 TaxID=2203201 RepID=UPI00163C50BB|nr:hypothetical protein [Streptomyces sp. WAC 00631]MCC5034913.1 hypothetical protein [Streptomyces sp. WAC 00631]
MASGTPAGDRPGDSEDDFYGDGDDLDGAIREKGPADTSGEIDDTGTPDVPDSGE